MFIPSCVVDFIVLSAGSRSIPTKVPVHEPQFQNEIILIELLELAKMALTHPGNLGNCHQSILS